MNPEMALPVSEPGSDDFVGAQNDWYFRDGGYFLEVIDGPVCLNDNAWWQLRSPNGILGWESDNHFLIEP